MLISVASSYLDQADYADAYTYLQKSVTAWTNEGWPGMSNITAE